MKANGVLKPKRLWSSEFVILLHSGGLSTTFITEKGSLWSVVQVVGVGKGSPGFRLVRAQSLSFLALGAQLEVTALWVMWPCPGP